ncbi:hypothetical protein [Komagataeibacter xylinus]|nr:hypothetical protein [Komagataeibacter xylinus]
MSDAGLCEKPAKATPCKPSEVFGEAFSQKASKRMPPFLKKGGT